MKRGGPLPPASATRLAEAEQRRAVVARALIRAGYRCELHWLGGCFGDLVGHELAHRSVYPGSHLIDDLVVAVCVGHNGWEDVQTNEVAQAAGVRVSAWMVDRYGTATVAAECRRIRRCRARGDDPGQLLWDRDDTASDAAVVVLDTPLPDVPSGRTVAVGATGVVSGALPAGTWDAPDPF